MTTESNPSEEIADHASTENELNAHMLDALRSARKATIETNEFMKAYDKKLSYLAVSTLFMIAFWVMVAITVSLVRNPPYSPGALAVLLVPLVICGVSGAWFLWKYVR